MQPQINEDLEKQLLASEATLKHIKEFLDPEKIAVDVGGYVGTYSTFFAMHSQKVYVFEPVQQLAQQIKNKLRDKVEVQACALSDVSGEVLKFYVPQSMGKYVLSRCSLNATANPGLEQVEVQVPVKRLDDYNLENVSILKIDVEGAEWGVLKGALETIKKSHPALVVEIEERQHPGQSMDIVNWVRDLGYEAFIVHDVEDRLMPVEDLDFKVHQDPKNLKDPFGPMKGIYLNNFVFKPIKK
ncbi:MAG: FkbM family methyltransferase [Alphaproteobacteria bacterium]|nr:FkbM family methyltransferase [Alphaproteobacteria bacterium]MCD8570249.1 FkbM family methyltransferase [Alphaproteobacteria bacterium]